MRLLPWTDERFDRVVSWFTSFGYFDDTDNRRVLQEAHRVLRPPGRLLIENNNLVELLPRWQPALVAERDGHFAIDRSCFDPTTGRATTERVIIRDGRTRRFVFSVRMFVAAELRDWLLGAGFTSVKSRRPAYRTKPPHDLHRVPVEATVQRSRYTGSSVPIMDQPATPASCPRFRT